MKGKLTKVDREGWFVVEVVEEETSNRQFPLHPDNCFDIDANYPYSLYTEVEFETVSLNGKVYALLVEPAKESLEVLTDFKPETEATNTVQYFLDRSKTMRRSVILYKMVGSVATPVMYLTRPKFVSEEEFNTFLDSVSIYVKNSQ